MGSRLPDPHWIGAYATKFPCTRVPVEPPLSSERYWRSSPPNVSLIQIHTTETKPNPYPNTNPDPTNITIWPPSMSRISSNSTGVSKIKQLTAPAHTVRQSIYRQPVWAVR